MLRCGFWGSMPSGAGGVSSGVSGGVRRKFATAERDCGWCFHALRLQISEVTSAAGNRYLAEKFNILHLVYIIIF